MPIPPGSFSLPTTKVPTNTRKSCASIAIVLYLKPPPNTLASHFPLVKKPLWDKLNESESREELLERPDLVRHERTG
jgi:hypothetical protein